MRGLASLALCLSLASGCAYSGRIMGDFELPAARVPACPCDFQDRGPAHDAEFALHYYGSGGWGVWWRGRYIVTAPYFTNANLLDTAVRPLRPSIEDVERSLRGTPIAKAQLLLAGHGHHDHTGDLELVAARMPPDATLLVNRSTFNAWHAVEAVRSRARPLSPAQDGLWLEPAGLEGFVRVMPLLSDHAPHALGAEFYDGTVVAPRAEPPQRTSDLRSGQTWAFLIDLLGADGAVKYRLHYMDAAADPRRLSRAGRGMAVPPAPTLERPVDVHLATAPGYHEVDNYPQYILRETRAGLTMAGHWEDFFRDPRRPLRTVVVLPVCRFEEFLRRVERSAGCLSVVLSRRPLGPAAGPWVVPVPGETFHVRRPEGAGACAPAPWRGAPFRPEG